MIGEIRRISTKEAHPLVEACHYSKNLPAGKKDQKILAKILLDSPPTQSK